MARGPGRVLSICAAAIFLCGIPAVTPAHADDPGAEVYDGVNQLRSCGPIAADPRLTAAAQRHAHDMLNNGVDGHTGSDGSSPPRRDAEARSPQNGSPGAA